MTEATLTWFANLMDNLSIPYDFMEWKEKPPEDYYFTGSYIETETMDSQESNHFQYVFILRGVTRKDWMLLERAKAKIQRNAKAIRTVLPDGTGLAVSYATGDEVPTGDASLKGIKINLNVDEWRVN